MAQFITSLGKDVWFADGERIRSFDPESGEAGRAVAVRSDAGTAFDGRYLFQLAKDGIRKIDFATGHVVATIPAPAAEGLAGLTWAEGTLWLALHHDGKIDPDRRRDRSRPPCRSAIFSNGNVASIRISQVQARRSPHSSAPYLALPRVPLWLNKEAGLVRSGSPAAWRSDPLSR